MPDRRGKLPAAVLDVSRATSKRAATLPSPALASVAVLSQCSSRPNAACLTE